MDQTVEARGPNPEGEPDIQLGRTMFALLMGPERWIHRKFERIDFVGARLARHRVSVDFELPEFATKSTSDTILVPLAQLQKRNPIANFDLRDEAGQSLPVLTRDQNSYVAWSTLVFAAQGVSGQTVSGKLREHLFEIAHTRRQEPKQALDELRSLRDPQAKLLSLDPIFGILLADLTRDFWLLTPLRDARRRRVLKFSYTAEVVTKRLPAGATVRRFLGWRPTGFKIELPGAGDAASFHFELQAPDGLYISEARLRARLRGEIKQSDQVPNEKVESVSGRELIHLYLSDVHRLAVGRGAVTFAPPVGFVGRIFVTVSFNAVLLLLGAIFFQHISATVRGNSVDAGVAVLLIASSLMSAYFARPGEHELRSRALFGLRSIVLLSGLATYIAALTLIVGLVGTKGSVVWIVLAALTTVAALLLSKTFLLTRKWGSIRTFPAPMGKEAE